MAMARRRKTTKSSAALSKRRQPRRSTALDLVRDLIGSVAGPADLSVNKTQLKNFGRSTLRLSDRRKRSARA
jgi:hypothetical protein